MVKELEDYAWFPARLRRYQMDFIGNVVRWLRLYQPLVPVVQQLMQQQQLHSITDCCSGNGAPALYMHQCLQPTPTTLLTDKFPQPFTPTDNISYDTNSRDALELVPQANQLYTFYNCFHHFSDAEQQILLQRFADNRASVVIAEILEPGIIPMLKIFFTTTVGQLLSAPFVRPFAWGRLAFTYLLPINLLTVTYDGLVSVCKSKTVKGYTQLMADVRQAGYTFRVQSIRQATGRIIYITGAPNT